MGDQIGNRVELVGMAVGAISGLMQSAIDVGGEVPLYVASHDQVEAAIAIVVHETGAGAPSTAAHASLGGNVSKSAVTVVVVKNIPAQVGDQQVHISIIVEITDSHPHTVGVALHSRVFRDVSKSAISVIAIEAVPVTRIGFVGQRPARHGVLNLRSIHEEQIEVAIVVVIEHGHAAAHGFREIFLAGAAGFLFESNAGFGGHVNEHRQRR